MKALTVHQPYASLIAAGLKLFETRSWQTFHRGPLAIHAGALVAMAQPESLCDLLSERFGDDWPDSLPRDKVIALARVDGCYPAAQIALNLPFVEAQCGDFSRGRWAWRLNAVQALKEPIAARGQQGLWDWEPDIGARLPKVS